VPLSYTAFNLRLESDLPIPGLPASPCTEATDVAVWLGAQPPWLAEVMDAASHEYYVNPHCDASGTPLLKVWLLGPHYFRLRYCDGTEFILDRSGTRVWATWPSPLTLEDTATYLLGPVLGFILRLRGTVCLHASAIAVEDKAIALLGPAGAGKSTTAAAFAGLGYPVMTDDVVSLSETNGDLVVEPAYPRLRLWPTSVEALYGQHDALPLLTPTWDKRYLDLTAGDYKFQSTALPLSAIYILGGRRPGAGRPVVRPVSPADGFTILLQNTYVNYLLDREMRATEFKMLSRAANRTALRHLNPPDSLDALSDLCGAILEDYHSLPRP
jgi:hypothetical protein